MEKRGAAALATRRAVRLRVRDAEKLDYCVRDGLPELVEGR